LNTKNAGFRPGQSPNYIGIAHFKPLFQFYKDDCYMFEVRDL
jgi:hypothetical protein